MPTFHCFDPHLKPDACSWTLPNEESHHLVKVLRAKRGDTVKVLNGLGLVAWGTMLDADAKNAAIQIEGQSDSPIPAPQVCLAVCIPKPKTIETVVRQATEMGVAGIQFLGSERSEVPKAFTESPKKLEKLYKIAQEACKQSENPFLPTIQMGKPLAGWLDGFSMGGVHWVAHPSRKNPSNFPPAEAKQPQKWVLIGAEGGLTDAEFTLAQSKGFIPVNLGRTVLRVETACVAACAKVAG